MPECDASGTLSSVSQGFLLNSVHSLARIFSIFFFSLSLRRQISYQNEHTLLVSLDADILVLLAGAGQCLVYGGHGAGTLLWLLLLLLLTG